MKYIKKVLSKNPMKINSDLYKMIKANNLDVQSITTDNGIEFAKLGLLPQWIDCEVYYAESLSLPTKEVLMNM